VIMCGRGGVVSVWGRCGGAPPPPPPPLCVHPTAFLHRDERATLHKVKAVSVGVAEGPVRESAFGETDALARKPQIICRMAILMFKPRQP
jgi:hypothetical protein